MKRSWIGALGVLVVLAASAQVPAQTPGSEAMRLYTEGFQAYQVKDYDKALDRFKKILEIKDLGGGAIKKAELHYNIGCVYALKGDKADAIASLKLAMKEGYTDFAYMKKDSDLECLREEPGFKELLAGGAATATTAAPGKAAAPPSAGAEAGAAVTPETPTAGFESVKLDFPYPTIDGEKFDWSTVNGKVVALLINGTWHSQVQKAAPALVAYREANKEKGFEIVALQFELLPIDDMNISDAKQFREKNKIGWPMLYAGDIEKIATAFPILKEEMRNKHPIIVFYDRKGTARQALFGKFDEKAFTDAATALIAER